VNYIISKRFEKKQQASWTRRGEYLLLQTREPVMNDDMRETFCLWFPGMNTE
jgi:hypothetical protein